MRFILTIILCFSLYAHGNNISTENGKEAFMTDFIQPQTINQWRIVNDGVMGGRSKGNLRIKQQNMIFNGNISLANNGGFSSVFRAIEQRPQNLDSVTLDVQGDGQQYQLRVVVYVDGYRLTYKHDFNTLADQRERLILSLDHFEATFRGRKLTNAPILKSQDIREIGFLMTKKQAGKFSLSIYHLMI